MEQVDPMGVLHCGSCVRKDYLRRRKKERRFAVLWIFLTVYWNHVPIIALNIFWVCITVMAYSMYFCVLLCKSFFQSTDQLVIEGPVRIYWGVLQPIQLQEFDNVPSVPSPTSWRHSFVPGDKVPNINPDLKVQITLLLIMIMKIWL